MLERNELFGPILQRFRRLSSAQTNVQVFNSASSKKKGKAYGTQLASKVAPEKGVSGISVTSLSKEQLDGVLFSPNGSVQALWPRHLRQ